MIATHCQCGEVYLSDESQEGKYFQCRKCKTINLITGLPVHEINSKSYTKGFFRNRRPNFKIKWGNKAWSYLGGALFFAIVISSFWKEKIPEKNNIADKVSSSWEGTIYEQKNISDALKKEDVHFVRPETGFRPYNRGFLSGHSSITVVNGTNDDAVVKVFRNSGKREIVRDFYIRSHDIFVVQSVPKGKYELLFAQGYNWNSVTKNFLYSQSFTRTDQFLVKESSFSDDQEVRTQYSDIRVTLHKVSNGNLRSSRISEKEFLME